jgi:endonuclease YncB( thermonuclease family)
MEIAFEMLRRSLLLAAPLMFAAIPALAQTTIYVPSQTQRFGSTIITNPTFGVPLGYGTTGQVPLGYGVQQSLQQQQLLQQQIQQQSLGSSPNIALPSRNVGGTDDVMTQGRARSDSSSPKVQSAPSLSSAPSTGGSQEKREVRGARIAGPAKVIDGNTLVIGPDVVVLHGADAPELGQLCHDPKGLAWNCGQRALDRLVSLVGSNQVVCVGAQQAVGGVAATCRVGTTDIGRQLVLEGLAIVPKAVAPVYLAEQASARAARSGIWVGRFTPPWSHRSGS